MFLVLGCVTAAAGVWALFSMPDSPMEVSWLTEAEKRVAIQRVAVNQTGIKNTHFKWRHLRELVVDPQIWLLTSLIIVVRVMLFQVDMYLRGWVWSDIPDLRRHLVLLNHAHPQLWLFARPQCAVEYAQRRRVVTVLSRHRLPRAQVRQPRVVHDGFLSACCDGFGANVFLTLLTTGGAFGGSVPREHGAPLKCRRKQTKMLSYWSRKR